MGQTPRKARDTRGRLSPTTRELKNKDVNYHKTNPILFIFVLDVSFNLTSSPNFGTFNAKKPGLASGPPARKSCLKLHRVPLVPTVWESKPIPVDKANELPVMLDFVFKETKRKFNLRFGQVREVDLAQALMRRFQGGQHRLLHARLLETARESLPAAGLDRLGVAFARTDDAPELIRDSVGRKVWQIQAQGFLIEMDYEVVREFE